MSKLGLRDRLSIGIRAALVIAVFSWAGISFIVDMIEKQQMLMMIQAIIVFLLYSICFVFAVLFNPERARLYYYAVLPLDLATLGLICNQTGNLSSVFIFGYFVAVGTFTLTFGLAPGIISAGLSSAIFALVDFSIFADGKYLDFIFEAAALLLFSLVMGLMAEHVWKELGDIRDKNSGLMTERDRTQRQIRELRAVSDVASLIHSTLDLDRLSALVVDVLAKVFEMDVCALTIINKKTGQTIFSAERGISGEGIKSDKTFSTEFDVMVGMYERPFLKCLLLIDEEDTTAMLYTTEQAAERLQKDDFQIMTSIATQLLVAVENVRLYELTKRYSITDELTQLYNYRYLQGELRSEIERSKRYNRPTSLLMIDVDHFKQYNDTYGHIKGDVVLSEIAMILKRCCREIDRVARYGGEEFAVILPETDSTGAYIVAEKMREITAAHMFLGKEGRRDARLTISLGVASCPEHAIDQEELLKAADNALYLAKNRGRNRTFGPEDRASNKAS